MFSVSKKVFSALVISVLFSAVIVPSSASADALCSSENTVMYVVAHADDALLFQNPDLQHDITLGKCVSTVFLTAGDAGETQPYWLAREEGAKSATAFMAGVSTTSTWTLGDAGISGHSVVQYTLDANPKITLVFFRLADGNIDGTGFSSNSYQSLATLFQSNPADNRTMTSLDGVTTYSRIGLINALTSLMVVNNPSRINTQDYVSSFGSGDHYDHHAAALFTVAAQANYPTLHSLYSYEDYSKWIHLYTDAPGGNVTGTDLVANHNAFFAYAPFDNHVCQNEEDCTPPSPHAGSYFTWLSLLFTNGSQEGGDICPNISGMQSTVPEGRAIIDGQCVLTVDLSCVDTVSSTDIVSDTSDIVSPGTSALATFIPYSWTADIPGATWIWNAFHPADPVNGETVTFTKTFTVNGTPTTGSLSVAADDSYTVVLNGTTVATVTDLDNYTSTTSDVYDVSAFLANGINTLTVTVSNQAMGVADPEVNPAGLLYKLSLSQNSCVPLPPVCPEGTTGTAPDCVAIPTDVCANLDGVQSISPEGYNLVGDQCTQIVVVTSGGGGGATPPACADGSDNDNDGKADFPQDPGCTDSLDNNETDPVIEVVVPPTTGGTDPVSTSTGEVLGATTELPLPPQCTPYLTSYLGMAKKNDVEEVKKLQLFLNETLGTSIPVNGFFGSMTRSAVKKFQKQYHAEILQPWIDAGYPVGTLREGTGYVFKTTKRWINMMKCTSEVIPMPELRG